MNFGKGDGVFASASLGAHLARGAAAALLGSTAVALQATNAWVSVGLGAASLFALRGCPVCWTLGLFETLASGPTRRA